MEKSRPSANGVTSLGTQFLLPTPEQCTVLSFRAGLDTRTLAACWLVCLLACLLGRGTPNPGDAFPPSRGGSGRTSWGELGAQPYLSAGQKTYIDGSSDTSMVLV